MSEWNINVICLRLCLILLRDKGSSLDFMRHYGLESSQDCANKRDGKTPSREVVITVGR